jgi:hypothetical protein
MDQNLKANQKYHCKYNHFLPQKSANLFRIFLGTLIDLQTYQTNRFPTQEHAGSKRTSTTKIPLHHHQAPKEPQPQKYHYIIIKLQKNPNHKNTTTSSSSSYNQCFFSGSIFVLWQQRKWENFVLLV